MRQIFLDTETTGLNANGGDRIIELGCVELVNRELTGNNLHLYFDPGRDSDPEALAVHGLTREFLSGYSGFEVHAREIADYLAGAEILIHNAPFDVGFLDMEFDRAGQAPLSEIARVEDTLVLAKSKYPGKRNSLDALCERLGISNQHRTLHGALLDSELLAQVYLAMTRGQFGLLDAEDSGESESTYCSRGALVSDQNLLVIHADEQELQAHHDYLNFLDEQSGSPCIWRRQTNPSEQSQR